MTACQNCASTEDVTTCSYDLDLPTIRLCQVCAVLLVADPDRFEEMGKRREPAMRGGDGSSGN